jgi:threonylcarbamoyladenosine tRNA methylthiotransferase MtaB
MHRRYRPWHYAQKGAALVQAVGPELTLGADVMVGFPGETDAEFEETLDLIRALPFGYLHLFPFSPRPGTALHATEPLDATTLQDRMAALRTLAAEKTRAHREQFVGREVAAITLHTPASLAARGMTSALTENFLPVQIAGRSDANQLCRARVVDIDAEMTLKAVAASSEPACAPSERATDRHAAVAV